MHLVMAIRLGRDFNMAFFRNFPVVNYNFGTETSDTAFQNLTAYIDLVDQIADDATFYEEYYIDDASRPDILSYELYGNVDLYWTFFLLNEKLRIQGWPQDNYKINDLAKVYYPNRILKSTAAMHGEFYIGDLVADRVNSDEFGTVFKGKILEKNYDLGQITVKPIIDVRSISLTNGGTGYTSPPTITLSGGGGTGATGQAVMTYLDGSEVKVSQTIQSIAVTTGGEGYTSAPRVIISEPNIANGTQATATSVLSSFSLPNSTTIYSQRNQPNVLLWDDDLVRSLIIHSNVNQYNAPHHYNNASGEESDLTIVAGGGVENRPAFVSHTPVTNLDRLIESNDTLRRINIFKPNVVSQVNSEFQKLLRS